MSGTAYGIKRAREIREAQRKFLRLLLAYLDASQAERSEGSFHSDLVDAMVIGRGTDMRIFAGRRVGAEETIRLLVARDEEEWSWFLCEIAWDPDDSGQLPAFKRRSPFEKDLFIPIAYGYRCSVETGASLESLSQAIRELGLPMGDLQCYAFIIRCPDVKVVPVK